MIEFDINLVLNDNINCDLSQEIYLILLIEEVMYNVEEVLYEVYDNV